MLLIGETVGSVGLATVAPDTSHELWLQRENQLAKHHFVLDQLHLCECVRGKFASIQLIY